MNNIVNGITSPCLAGAISPSQKDITFSALKSGPKTTLQLRDDYGVMNPSARVSELRKLYKIDRVKVSVPRNTGGWHYRVAKYTLIPEVI